MRVTIWVHYQVHKDRDLLRAYQKQIGLNNLLKIGDP